MIDIITFIFGIFCVAVAGFCQGAAMSHDDPFGLIQIVIVAGGIGIAFLARLSFQPRRNF